MLKNLLILSVFSFSVFAQAKPSLINRIVEGASVQEIQLAIEQGADVNAKNEYGQTALMWAASSENNLEVAKLLLQAGADANAKNNEGQTALMVAAFYGNSGIAQALLQARADVNARERSGITSLMTAAFYGHSDIVKLLLQAGASVNLKDNQGKTALAYARNEDNDWSVSPQKDYQEIVQALLQAGATQ